MPTYLIYNGSLYESVDPRARKAVPWWRGVFREDPGGKVLGLPEQSVINLYLPQLAYGDMIYYFGEFEPDIAMKKISPLIGGDGTKERNDYGVRYTYIPIRELSDKNPKGYTLSYDWGRKHLSVVSANQFPEWEGASRLLSPFTQKERWPAQAAAGSLVQKIEALTPEILPAAQRVLDEWDQDDAGYDEIYGGGGPCDDIAQEIQAILTKHGIDSTEGGQPGDDHAWVVAYDESTGEVAGVDIPHTAYEEGGGYSWRKIPDVELEPHDVAVWPLDVPVEEFLDEF